MITDSSLKAGLDDPIHDAQGVFRSLLHVMSRPGDVKSLKKCCEGVYPLNPVMAATALTLLDFETPFWLCEKLDVPDVATYLPFHTGAKRVADPAKADFLFVDSPESLPDLSEVRSGTPEYPDQSATIVLDITTFGVGKMVRLSGPGIENITNFSADNLDDMFWHMAIKNNAGFPLGVDFIFCGIDAVAALPRSTKIEL